MEVECLGACVNAPMLQIGSDFYEDLDGPITEKLLDNLRAGVAIKPGPQNSRHMSEPEGGALTLTDASLYDGSVVGKYKVAPPPVEAPKPKPPGAA
jgi:NADH-quinone oxidoreductase subunit E